MEIFILIIESDLGEIACTAALRDFALSSAFLLVWSILCVITGCSFDLFRIQSTPRSVVASPLSTRVTPWHHNVLYLMTRFVFRQEGRLLHH